MFLTVTRCIASVFVDPKPITNKLLKMVGYFYTIFGCFGQNYTLWRVASGWETLATFFRRRPDANDFDIDKTSKPPLF